MAQTSLNDPDEPIASVEEPFPDPPPHRAPHPLLTGRTGGRDQPRRAAALPPVTRQPRAKSMGQVLSSPQRQLDSNTAPDSKDSAPQQTFAKPLEGQSLSKSSQSQPGKHSSHASHKTTLSEARPPASGRPNHHATHQRSIAPQAPRPLISSETAGTLNASKPKPNSTKMETSTSGNVVVTSSSKKTTLSSKKTGPSIQEAMNTSTQNLRPQQQQLALDAAQTPIETRVGSDRMALKNRNRPQATHKPSRDTAKTPTGKTAGCYGLTQQPMVQSQPLKSMPLEPHPPEHQTMESNGDRGLSQFQGTRLKHDDLLDPADDVSTGFLRGGFFRSLATGETSQDINNARDSTQNTACHGRSRSRIRKVSTSKNGTSKRSASQIPQVGTTQTSRPKATATKATNNSVSSKVFTSEALVTVASAPSSEPSSPSRNAESFIADRVSAQSVNPVQATQPNRDAQSGGVGSIPQGGNSKTISSLRRHVVSYKQPTKDDDEHDCVSFRPRAADLGASGSSSTRAQQRKHMNVDGKSVDPRLGGPPTKTAHGGDAPAGVPLQSNTGSAQEQIMTLAEKNIDAPSLASQSEPLPRSRSAARVSRIVSATRATPSHNLQAESVEPERLGDVDYVRNITKAGNNGKLDRSMRDYSDAIQFRAAYAALGNEDLGYDVSVPVTDHDRLSFVRRVAEAMMYVEEAADPTKEVSRRKKRKQSSNGESGKEAKKQRSDTLSVSSRAIEVSGPSFSQGQADEDDNDGKLELMDDATWIKRTSPLLFEEKAWQLVYDAEAAQRGQYDIPDYNLLVGTTSGGHFSAFDKPIKYESFTDRMDALISKLRVRKDLVMWLFQTPFSKHLAANPTNNRVVSLKLST